jgi:citrate lyase subunit beta/citryl-CoA lyase
VVILDLEDAVGPDQKLEARAQAVAAVRDGGFGRREVVIRVNGLDTPWGAEDLAAAAEAGPDAVLVPKVGAPADVAAYAAGLGGRARLWIMVETGVAFLGLRELADAPGVEAWVIGSNDLAKEMRCRPGVDRAPLMTALSLAVMAARSRGLAVLDGVFNDIDDDAGLEAQCRQGAELGFDGKTLIHPRQVAAANRAFTPMAEEVEWSRVVAAAFDLPENAGKGVMRIEGRMVERLHLEEARRLIAVADALAAHEA